MREIGFAGIGAEDIIMHMVHIMEQMGLSVSVSNKTDLPACDILYAEENEKEGLDYCIYEDDIASHEFMSRDIKCIVTDIQPLNARKIRKKLKNIKMGSEPLVVIRDITGHCKRKNYISGILGIKNEPVVIYEKKKDFCVRCLLQEGLKYKIKNLSHGMVAGVVETMLRMGIVQSEDLKNTKRRNRIKWEKYLRFIQKQKRMHA